MEFLKESLKSEHEKLKIYSAFFGGLVAALGSILLKDSLSTVQWAVLGVTIAFTIVNILTIIVSLVKINTLLNLLKIKDKS